MKLRADRILAQHLFNMSLSVWLFFVSISYACSVVLFSHALGRPYPCSFAHVLLASFRFPPAFTSRSSGPTAQVSQSLSFFSFCSPIISLLFRVGIVGWALLSRVYLACCDDLQAGLSSSPDTGSIFGENLPILGSSVAYSLAIFIFCLLSYPCAARRGMYLHALLSSSLSLRFFGLEF